MYKYLLLAFLFLTPHLFFGNITYQNHNDKKNTTNFIQPAHLKKGDTILIIAPAGKIKDEEYIIAGIKLAKKWGLVIVYGKHLYAQENSFAGNCNEITTCHRKPNPMTYFRFTFHNRHLQNGT